MKVVYIASPYTKGDVAENVAKQIEAAHKVMDIAVTNNFRWTASVVPVETMPGSLA